MVQFIKGPWKSGEDYSTRLLSEEILKEKVGKGGITFKKMGLGFVGILGDSLPIEEHKKAAGEVLNYLTAELARTDLEKRWDMVIMDEVNVATSLGLIKAEDVLSALKNVPAEQIVIMTGRGAPQEFMDRADLATEMREVKHPYNDGKLGKINVEF